MKVRDARKTFDILLVDDNQADIRIMQEVFKECNLSDNLHVVTSGAEALDLLHHKGVYKNTPLPDLILLDLNMPGIDGFRVLSEIKSHNDLKAIPVIILSTSNSENDIRKAYELHANSYITKPAELESYFTIIKSIKEYWFNIAKLPMNE